VAELGIVIPTLARADRLRATLDRLARQQPRGTGERFEVIVALDAAARDPDALRAAAAGRPGGPENPDGSDRPYRLRSVQARRPGASAARNAGWRVTDAPLVLFLDDDVLALPGLVEAHLAAHERKPAAELGVLGHVRWARRPRPTPFMRWLDDGIQFDFRGLAPGADAGWWRLYTANASVERASLDRVGGFDEDRFPFGYEDLDLGARMAEHGFTLRYEPRAAAEHLHPQTLEDWRRRVARIATSERRFCERHPNARPYFRELFAEAAQAPAARGRGARLAGLVPRGVPWLGPRVWASFDAWHRQQLAGPFLAAWDAAGAHTDETASGPPGGRPSPGCP
jgi:GT2 family glycosyltransferase